MPQISARSTTTKVQEEFYLKLCRVMRLAKISQDFSLQVGDTAAQKVCSLTEINENMDCSKYLKRHPQGQWRS